VNPVVSAPCASLLYTSELTSRSSAKDVAAITRVSRINNRRDRITGLLVFDGDCFAQLVQGPSAMIDRLMARLLVDPRHQEIDVLLHESNPAAPQFPDWQLGFFSFDRRRDGLGDLRCLRESRGTDALKQFLDLVPSLELLAPGRGGDHRHDATSAVIR
jgi:hypothetical protein